MMEKPNEEYCAKLFNRNCDILKKFELLPDTVKLWKKKEIKECTQCLKRWRASSAKHSLEACALTLTEKLDLFEKNTLLKSEIESSEKITAESSLSHQIMKKGMLHNKENLENLKNKFIKMEVENKVNDFNAAESIEMGSLIFERINKLIKVSNENEEEIKRLSNLTNKNKVKE